MRVDTRPEEAEPRRSRDPPNRRGKQPATSSPADQGKQPRLCDSAIVIFAILALGFSASCCGSQRANVHCMLKPSIGSCRMITRMMLDSTIPDHNCSVQSCYAAAYCCSTCTAISTTDLYRYCTSISVLYIYSSGPCVRATDRLYQV